MHLLNGTSEDCPCRRPRATGSYGTTPPRDGLSGWADRDEEPAYMDQPSGLSARASRASIRRVACGRGKGQLPQLSRVGSATVLVI